MSNIGPIILVGGVQIPAGVASWSPFNHAGTGGAQASGATLTLVQTRVLLDTTAGACLAVFPANPVDGQKVTFKDGSTNGHWGVTAGQAQGNAGQVVELPMSPGSFSAAAGTVDFPIPGGSITYVWSSVVNSGSWLLE